MPKFKNRDEYNDWKMRQAISRQGARDLEKLDEEHPYYEGAKVSRVNGLWVVAGLLLVLAAVLYLWPDGREALVRLLKGLVR